VSTVDEGAGRLRLPSLGASAMKVILPYRQLIEDIRCRDESSQNLNILLGSSIPCILRQSILDRCVPTQTANRLWIITRYHDEASLIQPSLNVFPGFIRPWIIDPDTNHNNSYSLPLQIPDIMFRDTLSRGHIVLSPFIIPCCTMYICR
jgi:hypothetical protein